jgi:hypothetical protein
MRVFRRSPLFRSTALRSAGCAAALCLSLTTAGCADEAPPEAPRTVAVADTALAATRYTREFVFVGERAGVPLVVPFVFITTERGAELQREVLAWLSHGSDWDGFLRESWNTPAGTGVWTVLPRGDLRVIAGGTSEVEALLFRQGERRLRLAPEILRATWAPQDETQYRLFEGRLDLAGQAARGSVLEAYRVHRGVTDEMVPAGALDWLYVTDGASIHLLLSEAMGAAADPDKTFAWTVLPDQERTWDRAELRWIQMQPVETARRDAPVAWSFRVPGAGIEGEVYSLGSDVEVGPDRPGRRTLLARHNVEGWATIGAERYRVFGLLRHSQD